MQVVIGRYQGEKKISSLPYTLTMNANNHASLRMGTSMPVVMFSPADPATPEGVAPPTPVQYPRHRDQHRLRLDRARRGALSAVDDGG